MMLRRIALAVGLAAAAASAGCYAGYADEYGYGYGYPTADVYVGGAYYPRYYGHHPGYYRSAPVYGYGYRGAPVYRYHGRAAPVHRAYPPAYGGYHHHR
jgi:hypothetical protein